MGIIAANSEYVIAANALVAPASRIDTTIADPAPTCPASPVMAVPIAAKIPAPMMAPIPSAVSWSGPSERRRPPPALPSAMHWSTVLRSNSRLLDKQRRQHQRDRAQQLDQHMQRRAGGVLERIAHRVAHDRGLVGGAALPTVLAGLDVLLGVVPGAAAVVEHRGDEDAADRAHRQEGGDALRSHPKHLEEQPHRDRHADREQPRRDHRPE